MLHFTSQLREPGNAGAAALKWVFSIGWSGVDLFFVLSGFLITGILADTRGRPDRWRSFYVRRALRILPLYYGSLVLLFGVPLLIGSSVYVTSPAEQLPYWLYLQNLLPLSSAAFRFCAHLWSLAIEEQFYLVWPLVIFGLTRRNAVWACAACIAAASAYRIGSVLILDDFEPIYFHTLGRMDGLAVGGAIALLARTDIGPALLRRSAPRVAAGSLLLLGGAAFHPSGFNPKGEYMLLVGYLLLALFFGAVLVMAVYGEFPGLSRVLSGRILRGLGKYSYGLYVLHVPVLALAMIAGLIPGHFAGTPWELPAFLGYLAVLGGVTFVAALASWRVLEEPFLRLRSRVAADPAVPGAGTPAAPIPTPTPLG